MFLQTLLKSKSVDAPIQSMDVMKRIVSQWKGPRWTLTSEGDHDVGSLMLKKIVNFGWEHKYYPEQLVAAHMSGTYIAYAITTPGKGW